ncbi:MAG: hypothetical protein EA397_18945 [Deltaproteobacteria bacterium]|nr:MAG: hypothetical protein EA397_18945 [Deltaproteobacteria bacterium]
MESVHSAVKAGRCVIAVGAHLLRDPAVLLNLRDREGAVPSVALSGPVVAPVSAIGAEALARATGQPGGVVALVEPEDADWSGLEAIAELLKASPHKPSVVVIGRPPQPLRFSMLFRGLSSTTEKGRGASFIKKLPTPDPSALPQVEAPAATKPRGAPPAEVPLRVFVGRDEEVEALGALLGEGGPIVVSGPEGVGRNALIDAAVAGSGLRRPLDVMLGRGAGFDTLAGRLAELTDGAGASQLAAALTDPKASPLALAAAALEALKAAEGLSDVALVVQPLEVAAGRELDFFRKDALAYFVQQLLAARYPLRLIFVAQSQPAAFDHDASQAVRRLEVGGIKGRFYHEIFEATHLSDVPRDKFGPVSERIHGHPLAVRLLALDVRDRDEGLDLLDQPKLFKVDDIHDTSAIRRRIRKRVEKLPQRLRGALGVAAHLRWPATGAELTDLGLSRKERLALISAGLLFDVGGAPKRRYRVHPLVAGCLRYREVADFDVLGRLGEMYKSRGSAAEGVDRIAFAQEANRCFHAARRYRDTIRFRFPDRDPELDAITGMIRSKKPNYELARERLSIMLEAWPACSEAHLLKLELMSRLNAPREAVDQAAEQAMTLAPIPEVFHDYATTLLGRKGRQQAIAVLERGLSVMPSEVRLKTRLAALLLREGRRPEALDRLKQAMEEAPMLPDAYGLLGMARYDEGEQAIEDAEALLREAVRLAPNDPVQVPRLVHVLLAKARVAEPTQAEQLRGEARELLSEMARDERKSPEGYLMLARLETEVGNLDRADWLLGQARKRTDRRHERNTRIRIEGVFVAIRRNELDKAEQEVRALAAKDQRNHRIFVALSQVLEARGQLIPAHAELLRAAERVSQNTLEGKWVASELARLQAAIESQMANMAAGLPEPARAIDEGEITPPEALTGPRTTVRRRRRESGAGDDAAGAVGPESSDPAPSEAAAAPKDVLERAPAPEQASATASEPAESPADEPAP